MARRQDGTAGSLRAAGGAAALAAALLVLCRFRRRAAFAMLALGTCEMLVFARGTLATFDLAAHAPEELRAAVRQFPRDSRILHTGDPNLGVLLGVGDIWGADPSVVGRYASFIAWTQGWDPDGATQSMPVRRYDPLHCLLRLGRVLEPSGRELVILVPPVAPLPHVSLISRHVVRRERDAVFAALRRPGFDPRSEVVLESEPSPAPVAGGEPGTVRLVAQTTDSLTIEAETPRPALLLVTDTYTPAWRARALPGSVQASYEVMPADYVLRAVPLSAGSHRLVLEYAPRAFTIGAAVSALALLLWAGAWLVVARAAWYPDHSHGPLRREVPEALHPR